jgi:hypothetical protein
LLNLTFRVGQLSDENIAGGVYTSFGFVIKHCFKIF